jgi:hypothetical protein
MCVRAHACARMHVASRRWAFLQKVCKPLGGGPDGQCNTDILVERWGSVSGQAASLTHVLGRLLSILRGLQHTSTPPPTPCPPTNTHTHTHTHNTHTHTHTPFSDEKSTRRRGAGSGSCGWAESQTPRGRGRWRGCLRTSGSRPGRRWSLGRRRLRGVVHMERGRLA